MSGIKNWLERRKSKRTPVQETPGGAVFEPAPSQQPTHAHPSQPPRPSHGQAPGGGNAPAPSQTPATSTGQLRIALHNTHSNLVYAYISELASTQSRMASKVLTTLSQLDKPLPTTMLCSCCKQMVELPTFLRVRHLQAPRSMLTSPFRSKLEELSLQSCRTWQAREFGSRLSGS